MELNGDPNVLGFKLAVNPKTLGHREDTEMGLAIDTDQGRVFLSMNLITAQVLASQLIHYVAALQGYDGNADGFIDYWNNYQMLIKEKIGGMQ